MPHLDKAGHLCAYLLFAWLLVQAIRRHHFPQREYPLLAWMCVTGYGLLMEMIQLMVPWRSAEWGDVLINAAGAALGVWLGQRLPSVKDAR